MFEDGWSNCHGTNSVTVSTILQNRLRNTGLTKDNK